MIVRTLETTPDGATHWSTRRGEGTGLSHGTIARIWRAFGLQPIANTFTCRPTRLVEKVRDVVGCISTRPAAQKTDSGDRGANRANRSRPGRSPSQRYTGAAIRRLDLIEAACRPTSRPSCTTLAAADPVSHLADRTQLGERRPDSSYAALGKSASLELRRPAGRPVVRDTKR